MLAVLSIEYSTVIAEISPRQDNILSPFLDPAIDAVGKWIVEPAIDGVVTGVGALKDAASDGLNTIMVGTTDFNNANPSLFLQPSTRKSQEQSSYKLEIHQESTSRASTKNRDCNTANNRNSKNCQKTNPVVIFPTKCASPRNKDITALLTEWVGIGDFWISHSSQCGGIIFWCVKRLTNDQTEQLHAMTDVVSSIEPDTETRPDGVLQRQESINDSSQPITKRSLQRRNDVSIQRDAMPDLAYVSNPQGSNKEQRDYYHLTGAGQGITIYLLEQGVEEVPEFTVNSVIQRWLFSKDAKRTKSDDSLSGHGTCVGSKISGLRYGTIKRGTIVNVKMKSDSRYDENLGQRIEFIPTSSVVDGMQQVINDLKDRTDRGEEVKGFTVANLSFGVPDGGALAAELKSQIRTLVDEYEAVLVTSAGNVESSPSAQISKLPAVMSPGYDIVVVGSIDIQNDDLDPGSCRGPQMTITAPGDVICSSKMGTDLVARGTSGATGAVTGVIAGFMSSAWGKMIRESRQPMPKAVKDYIVKRGLKRNWDRPGPWMRRTVSLWNGLDPDLEPPLYGWSPI